MGGTRQVPAPDPIATDYLLLGLRLDQHLPGLVDGYFGPADLKARVDLEQRRAPARLRDDAVALGERVAAEVPEPDRRAWLLAQLTALEAHALDAMGEPLPYREHVERCLGVRPAAIDDQVFADARAEVEVLLPGPGPVADRLEAWDRSIAVPLDRLPAAVEWLVDRFRQRAATDFGLPEGEGLRVSMVRGQPWSAYDWYDGGRRSRVDVNADLPIAAPTLIDTVAHETYPGHHLEHAWKEAVLVDGAGRLEASMLLLDTPECPISEGLAEVGTMFAAPLGERVELLVDSFDRVGMPIAQDPGAGRDLAERAVALAAPRRTLATIRGSAALRRHADGASHDEVLEYLRDVGGYAADVATRTLAFVEHPRWRAYVFAYADGEALVRRWLESVPAPDRIERFGRLLREHVTPGRLLAELDRT